MFGDNFIIQTENYCKDDLTITTNRLNGMSSEIMLADKRKKYHIVETSDFWRTTSLDVLDLYVSDILGKGIHIVGIQEFTNLMLGDSYWKLTYKEYED